MLLFGGLVLSFFLLFFSSSLRLPFTQIPLRHSFLSPNKNSHTPLSQPTRQSQLNFFLRFTPNPSEHTYAIQRYAGETERLYGVLNTHLANRDYVAGAGRGRYSIANISLVTAVNVSRFSSIDLRRQFPNLQAWLDRILARPAVRKGLAVPSGLMKVVNEALEGAVNGGDGEEAEGLRKVVEEGDRLVREAKEKFGYVYSSP